MKENNSKIHVNESLHENEIIAIKPLTLTKICIRKKLL